MIVLVAGCTNSNDPSAGGSSTTNASSSSTSGKPTTAAGVDNLFDTGSAKSVVGFWASNPERMPEEVSDGKIFINKKSKGPGVFAVPEINKSQSLIVVITCNNTVPYEVSIQNSKNVNIDWTKGDSCGGPSINTYITAAAKAASSGDVIKVAVPSDTEYFITAYLSK